MVKVGAPVSRFGADGSRLVVAAAFPVTWWQPAFGRMRVGKPARRAAAVGRRRNLGRQRRTMSSISAGRRQVGLPCTNDTKSSGRPSPNGERPVAANASTDPRPNKSDGWSDMRATICSEPCIRRADHHAGTGERFDLHGPASRSRPLADRRRPAARCRASDHGAPVRVDRAPALAALGRCTHRGGRQRP